MTTSKPQFEPKIGFFPEPLLEFRMGQKLVYPRDGLYLHGPVGNIDQLPAIRYGVIGTADGVRRFRNWAEALSIFLHRVRDHARLNLSMCRFQGLLKRSMPNGQSNLLAPSPTSIRLRLIGL